MKINRALLRTLVFPAVFALCGYSLVPVPTPSSPPQETAGTAPGHDNMDRGGMRHNHAMAMPGSAPASSGSDTEWSVFNHRGAGFFIVAWGLTALIAGLWPRRTWLRFVPPLTLLGLVEFLLLRND